MKVTNPLLRKMYIRYKTAWILRDFMDLPEVHPCIQQGSVDSGLRVPAWGEFTGWVVRVLPHQRNWKFQAERSFKEGHYRVPSAFPFHCLAWFPYPFSESVNLWTGSTRGLLSYLSFGTLHICIITLTLPLRIARELWHSFDLWQFCNPKFALVWKFCIRNYSCNCLTWITIIAGRQQRECRL